MQRRNLAAVLALIVACARAHRQPVLLAQTGAESIAVEVKPAEWWTESASPDNLLDRAVYVGSVWQNVGDDAITLRVHYDLYTKDGRLVASCDGDAEFVRPKETAWGFCAAEYRLSALAARRADFQIVTKLARVSEEPARPRHTLTQSTAIVDSGVKRRRGTGTDDVDLWTRARVLDTTALARAAYHLYSKDGVQVGYCGSNTATFPKGIVILVSSSDCARIPHHLGGVDHVQTDWIVAQADEPPL